MNRGFTLIEILIAIFLISIILVAVSGIFIQSLRIQKRALALQRLQGDINFFVEKMAREIRVSVICPPSFQCGSLPSVLRIEHPINGRIEYFLSGNDVHRVAYDSNNNCSSPPCDTILNSSNISFTRLDFKVDGTGRRATGNEDNKQPRVTAVLNAESSELGQKVKLDTQITLSQRARPASE